MKINEILIFSKKWYDQFKKLAILKDIMKIIAKFNESFLLYHH